MLWVMNLVMAAVLLSIAVWLQRRAARLPVREQFLGMFLPAALALCLGVVLDRAGANLDFNWSPVRLAPAFAIRYGETVYPGLNEGPVSGHIYGPMAALIYLPTTLCASPSAALRLGGLIAAAIFFLPMLAYLAVAAGGSKRGLVWAGWGGVLFFLLVLRSDTLSYNAFFIHAEAPALGFAVAACAVLVPGIAGSKWGLPLAALLVVGAVSSKQTLLPVMVALPLYLWWRDGLPVVARFCGWLAGALLVAGVIFSVWFGAEKLWLNEIVVPSNHPWLGSLKDTSLPWIRGQDYGARLAVLVEAGLGLLHRCAKALVIMMGLAFGKAWENGSGSSASSWLSRIKSGLRQPWGLTLWVALWLIPTTLLGRVKAGGDNNAYGPATYFVCLSAVGWLMLTAQNWSAHRGCGCLRLQRFIWPGLVGAQLLAAWMVVTEVMNFQAHNHAAMDRAVSYARAHPGRVYFPWNPLLTLMAEQRAYHFAYGVYDRELAGMPVTPEHFRAGLPADVQEVLYATHDERQLLAAYLTDFTEEVQLPELPGWAILRRAGAKVPASPAP
jgi:hypothetical protein